MFIETAKSGTQPSRHFSGSSQSLQGRGVMTPTYDHLIFRQLFDATLPCIDVGEVRESVCPSIVGVLADGIRSFLFRHGGGFFSNEFVIL